MIKKHSKNTGLVLQSEKISSLVSAMTFLGCFLAEVPYLFAPSNHITWGYHQVLFTEKAQRSDILKSWFHPVLHGPDCPSKALRGCAHHDDPAKERCLAPLICQYPATSSLWLHYWQGSQMPGDSILWINAGRNIGNRGGEGRRARRGEREDGNWPCLGLWMSRRKTFLYIPSLKPEPL